MSIQSSTAGAGASQPRCSIQTLRFGKVTELYGSL